LLPPPPLTLPSLLLQQLLVLTVHLHQRLLRVVVEALLRVVVKALLREVVEVLLRVVVVEALL
jgi:hypothetical protein